MILRTRTPRRLAPSWPVSDHCGRCRHRSVSRFESARRADSTIPSSWPRCIAMMGAGEEPAASKTVRAIATAPPNQQAATPIPPQAKPGAGEVPVRSADGAPRHVEQAIRTARDLGQPDATCHARGATLIPGAERSTSNRPRPPSGRCAVISARSTRSAREHHGFVR